MEEERQARIAGAMTPPHRAMAGGRRQARRQGIRQGFTLRSGRPQGSNANSRPGDADWDNLTIVLGCHRPTAIYDADPVSRTTNERGYSENTGCKARIRKELLYKSEIHSKMICRRCGGKQQH